MGQKFNLYIIEISVLTGDQMIMIFDNVEIREMPTEKRIRNRI
jgi:hypothetical protein